MTRRHFLASAAAAQVAPTDAILDIHQHTHYSGRTDEALIAHQRTMGISKSVLLPAGSRYGLAADAWGNDSCLALVRKFPNEYVFFANELPDIAETRAVLEKYLKLGAVGIGEQKYPVECDSPHIDLVASIAREFNVPVLLHFQFQTYNLGYENFHRVLARHPRVNFIGHAQTFWANIAADHPQEVLYPKTKVAPGGWTDRYLRDYPNMFADMSAGSGLNALLRDEDHARDFLKRHQDKLLYGSDCNDTAGEGSKCSGAQQIAAIRRLAPDAAIQRKIFNENARRVIRFGSTSPTPLRPGATAP